jgi:hypothetical protein
MAMGDVFMMPACGEPRAAMKIRKTMEMLWQLGILPKFAVKTGTKDN